MNFKKSLNWLSVLVVTLSIFAPLLIRAGILDNWHWRNPVPFSDTMRSVTYGAGKFVAVGDGGTVHTSTDGMSWDVGQRPVLFTLNKVIYANGKFVAVGNSGTVITSLNGVDWTVQNSNATNDLYAVAFGNGRFVVVGSNGQQIVSTDGQNWIAGTNASVGPLWITFGNGLFVAPGPGTSVEVSADGQNWTGISVPIAGVEWPHTLYQVEFGNGVFVAVVGDEAKISPVTSQPTSHFYASADGTNWVQKANFDFGPGAAGAYFDHLFFTFLNGAFHEVTQYSSYPPRALPITVTFDGTSSTTTYGPLDAQSVQSMAYGNGKYLLVELSGKSWVSTDETNWTAVYGGVRAGFLQIILGNSNFVAFANSLSIEVSSDGINFYPATNSPSGVLIAGDFDGTNYVAVGATRQGGLPPSYIGEIYTSTNASDWVRRTSNANQPLYAICRGPSRWVAVGGNGAVTTSPNTLAWTLRTSGTGNNLDGVAFGNGVYVAVGAVGTVITSPDGAAWDVQFSGTTVDLLSVRFLNGQFIATGRGGTIITSSDGVAWTNQNSGTTASLYAVACGYGGYLVCGYDDVSNPSVGDIFLTSSNGVSWQNISRQIPTATTARSVAYLNQSFWIVGDNGLILQSDVADGIPHLSGTQMPGNGGVKLNISLNPPANYRVQFRTNLLTDTWHDIYVQTNSITSDSWTDTNAFQLPSGFYRIVSP